MMTEFSDWKFWKFLTFRTRKVTHFFFYYNLIFDSLCLAALYQFYTKTYISKEIRRTVCRNISKTSIDFQMDTLNTTNSEKGAESARSSPVPTIKQTSLWQDLPEVQDSGVLETLTPEQRKYQEVSWNLHQMCNWIFCEELVTICDSSRQFIFS